jgi:hypothetical protein
MALSALVLVLVQAGVGMAVNLYVTVPAHHPGGHASSFVSGSLHSIVWAIGHGATALAVHASLGLVLTVVAVLVVVRTLRSGRRRAGIWSVAAAVLVLGAGFNGVAFLDYGHNVNSLIMALLAFAGAACYGIALYTLASD